MITKHAVSRVGAVALTLGILIIVWENAVDLWKINILTLPAPSDIYRALINNWDNVQTATLLTGLEVIVGLICGISCGILLAFIMYSALPVRHLLQPLLISSQTIPMIAVAPLLIIWFGFGMTNKILLVGLYAFFPITISFLKGMNNATTDQLDVATTLGASRWWKLLHVNTPAACPQLFSGIKIAVTYAPSTAALAEYVGARQGLGIMLVSAQASFRTDLVFVAAVILIVMSLLLYLAVSALESVVVTWSSGGKND